MADLTFTTKSKKSKKKKDDDQRVIEFTIDDDKFTFLVPKQSVLLLAAMEARTALDDVGQVQVLFELLDECMPSDQMALIRKRLRDKDDPLDVEQLAEYIEKIFEAVSERPTK